jgi:hypothetical protein
MNQLTTDIVSIANTLRVRPKLSRSLRAKMYRACIPGVIKNSQASNPEKHIVPYKKKSTCAQENLSAHLILELLNKLSLLLLLAAFRSVFHKLKEKTYYDFIEVVGYHNVGMHISRHHLLHHHCIPLFAVKLMLAALPSIMLPLF